MSRVSREYFAQLYDAEPDPWRFETSRYEQRKYAVTLASLPEERYRSAYEPGCSVGVLTEMLAERCDRLLATDILPSVVARAAARVAGYPGVTVRCQTLPDEWPDGEFDLIVLSELGYYFPPAELDTIVALAVASLEPGGTLVAVHWRGTTNYPLTGDQVHQHIDSRRELGIHACHEERAFVLGCWKKRTE